MGGVTQLKSSIKSLGDNVVFYDASEEKLKNELAAAIKESTRLLQVAEDIHAELVDFRGKFCAKDGITWFIDEDSRASLGLSLRDLAEIFRAGLDE